MKHFKKPDGSFWAFNSDGSQDHRITQGMTPVTLAEIEVVNNPPPTAEQIIAAFTAAIQARLDAFAQTRLYDGILSVCTYATSSVPSFAAEAAYCVAQRDATWEAGYTILADVQGGRRSMPTVEQVMAELPALEWPQ